MIVVTGATGKLGRLVIEGLLLRVPAAEITAAVRDPARAADFAERGVDVRRADYDEPDTLDAAIEGADRVLLISSNNPQRAVAQHAAVIDAVAGRRRSAGLHQPVARGHFNGAAGVSRTGTPNRSSGPRVCRSPCCGTTCTPRCSRRRSARRRPGR